MEIRRLAANDVELVQTAGALFDHLPAADLTTNFLGSDTHHCLIAYLDGESVGFVTGVDIHHPDKETEMLLYELGVAVAFRGRGIGRALVEELSSLAQELGHRGMWVLADEDNLAAIRVYRSAGAEVLDRPILLEWVFTDR